MKPKLFPTHFNIILDATERSALEALYDLHPLVLDEVEMVHKALREGIKVLNRDAEKLRQDPDRGPTRTEVEALKRSEGSRMVENYVGFPVSERLRKRLADFLSTVAVKNSEEETFALLLERGLDSIVRSEEARTERSRKERRQVRRALVSHLFYGRGHRNGG